MPAKAKVSRDMIEEAAFRLVRAEGHEALSARRLAARLNCSTQPLLYHFSGIEAIRRAAYERADAFHTAYITDVAGSDRDPMLEIGLRYVRFAAEEGPLFRFLFQSGQFAGRSLEELIASPEAEPLRRAAAEATGLPEDEARSVFGVLFVCVHGWASLLANNAMRYDPAALEASLVALYEGMMEKYRGESHEDDE